MGPGTYTSWSYNTDDSISEIVDPRLAVTDFTYNSRGMTTQIAYTPFSGGVDTPTVDYAYDNAGNRTSMTTAGVSVQTYAYNELSQLTSETTNFDDLSNDLTLSYTYDLGGGLRSITDPFSKTVNYTDDKAGRVTSVTGDTFAENTTGNYASNIKYRAFGSVKQMDYDMPGGDSHIKVDYDSGLRASHSEASLAGSTSTYLLKADYSYAADGRLSAKDDLLDDKWDRTNSYDFAGRLTSNSFGIDPLSSKSPYGQELEYDAFSQITLRGIGYWGNGAGYTASYTNGRKTSPNAPTYDAAGNITFEAQSIRERQTSVYDAAGRKVTVQDRWPQLGVTAWEEDETDYVFDGDGHPVIQEGRVRSSVATTWPSVSPFRYQVWSSVLGSSLTTVDTSGGRVETKVFAGGTHIATQTSEFGDHIVFNTADPVTGTTASYGGSASTGNKDEESEPLGHKKDHTDPASLVSSSYNEVLGVAKDPEWQCQIDPDLYATAFTPMPAHCQKSATQNIYGTVGGRHREESPNNNLLGFSVAGFIETPTTKPEKGGPHADPDAPCVHDPEHPGDCVDPIPGFKPASSSSASTQVGERALLDKADQERYSREKTNLLSGLQAKSLPSACSVLLAKIGNLTQIIEAITLQRAYDGTKSTIGSFDAGLLSNEDLSSLDAKNQAAVKAQTIATRFKSGNDATAAAIAGIFPNGMRGSNVAEMSSIYFRPDSFKIFGRALYGELSGLNQRTILHEALHSLSGLNDVGLYEALTGKVAKDRNAASKGITAALEDAGCVK